jgi:hypothetical protein
MKYKGMWDVLSKAVEKEGVRGLYKVNLHPQINLNIPGSVSQFEASHSAEHCTWFELVMC